jgi:hypothetical protein
MAIASCCGRMNTEKEGSTMLPIDLLSLVGAAAVFPYIAEGAYHWVRNRGRHTKRANAPD